MPVSLKTRCPRSGARMMFLQTTLQVMCHSDIPTFIIATFQNVNPMHVHNSILRRVKASPTRRTQNCFAAHATVRYTACHVENCLPQFSLRGSGGGPLPRARFDALASKLLSALLPRPHLLMGPAALAFESHPKEKQ